MLRTDRTVAIVIIGVSILLFLKTSDFLGESANIVNSAAFFPRFYITTLIICCLLIALQSKKQLTVFPSFKITIAAIVLIAGYAFLIEPAGYFIVTPAFLFALPSIMGYRRWGWLTVFSVGGTVFSYIVFYKILGVPLPLGILESLGGIS